MSDRATIELAVDVLRKFAANQLSRAVSDKFVTEPPTFVDLHGRFYLVNATADALEAVARRWKEAVEDVPVYAKDGGMVGTVRVTRFEECNRAAGKTPHKCPVCLGAGKFFDPYATTGAPYGHDEPCKSCGGTGVLWR